MWGESLARWKLCSKFALGFRNEATFNPTRKGARVVEEARLESVYSPKGNRRFESYPFRNCF